MVKYDRFSGIRVRVMVRIREYSLLSLIRFRVRVMVRIREYSLLSLIRIRISGRFRFRVRVRVRVP